MLFDIRTTKFPPWIIVNVVGDIDLASMPGLNAAMTSADAELLALDVSGVDHFDPVTSGVLVAGSLRQRRRGGRFGIVCPSGRVRELLAETGLDRIIAVVGDREDLVHLPT